MGEAPGYRGAERTDQRETGTGKKLQGNMPEEEYTTPGHATEPSVHRGVWELTGTVEKAPENTQAPGEPSRTTLAGGGVRSELAVLMSQGHRRIHV